MGAEMDATALAIIGIGIGLIGVVLASVSLCLAKRWSDQGIKEQRRNAWLISEVTPTKEGARITFEENKPGQLRMSRTVTATAAVAGSGAPAPTVTEETLPPESAEGGPNQPTV